MNTDEALAKVDAQGEWAADYEKHLAAEVRRLHGMSCDTCVHLISDVEFNGVKSSVLYCGHLSCIGSDIWIACEETNGGCRAWEPAP